MKGKEGIKMYELLCTYAEMFGHEFPLSAVMKTSNENGVIQILQKCINSKEPYKTKETEKPKGNKRKTDKAK
jgi:hypothetical protein